MNDYLIYEPDPDDEFYDELCTAAWDQMSCDGVFDYVDSALFEQ